MTISIKEQLVVAYAAAIALISVERGYTRNIELVDRLQLTGMDESSNSLVQVVQGVDVMREGANGVEERTLSMHTVVKFRHDPKLEKVSSDTVANQYEQDVYRAVLLDPTFGGLAFTTRWVLTEGVELDEDTNRGSLAIHFELDYRHQVGDMTINA